MKFMQRKVLVPSFVAFASAIGLAALAPATRDVLEFEELEIFLETNDTDQDAEIVCSAETDDGIVHFVVHDPSLRPILDVTSSDGKGIGLAEILIESAEPDIQSVLEAYPEGRYRFAALTVNGDVVRGAADLTHDLLSPPRILEPQDGGLVDRDAFEVIWQLDPNAAGYILEVEGQGMELTLELPPNVDHLLVPASLLERSSEYQIGVLVKGTNGNRVAVEIHCRTLP